MSRGEWALGIGVVIALWLLATAASEVSTRWAMRDLKEKRPVRASTEPGRLTVALWSLRRRWGSKR